MDKDLAMEIWELHFGKKENTKDFMGRTMYKSAYGNSNSNYEWQVDHAVPVSKGGKDIRRNLMPCHRDTNQAKADKYEWIDNKLNMKLTQQSNTKDPIYFYNKIKNGTSTLLARTKK